MKRIVLLFAVSALAAGGAWVQSATIPISGVSTTMETIDPGQQWTDDDGVLHIRGMITRGMVTAQDENGVPYTGIGLQSFTINIDLATGNGDLNGRRYDTEYTYGDLRGPFEGRIVATYTAWNATGQLNYHGSGDFEGWKFRGTYTNTWGSGEPSPFEGILHNPHGN